MKSNLDNKLRAIYLGFLSPLAFLLRFSRRVRVHNNWRSRRNSAWVSVNQSTSDPQIFRRQI